MAYSQRIAAAILVAVVGSATRAVAVPFPGPVNLLANPGFETGDFTGWTVGRTSPQFGVATDGTPIPFPSTDQVLNPAFQNVGFCVGGDSAAGGYGQFVSAGPGSRHGGSSAASSVTLSVNAGA
jgi:hypothetical protein